MAANKHLVLSSFVLKIVAMIAVIIDHTAVIFINPNSTLYLVMRIIGRLAFVLYSFFVFEGVRHTKNKSKYFLRLFYLYLILQAMIIFVLIYDPFHVINNVFLTLLAAAGLLIYLEEKKWQNVYYLIPLVVTLTFTTISYFNNNPWFLVFAGEYGFYGLVLILSFYGAHKFATYLLNKYPSNENTQDNYTQKSAQQVYNVASCVSLLIVTSVWYILSVYFSEIRDAGIQSYALLVIPLLLLYSGELGHNSKLWRKIYYGFFPAQAGIFALLSLLI